MAPAELKMIDEETDVPITNDVIAIVLSDNCIVERNVLTIPRNEALKYVMNMLIQIELTNV